MFIRPCISNTNYNNCLPVNTNLLITLPQKVIGKSETDPTGQKNCYSIVFNFDKSKIAWKFENELECDICLNNIIHLFGNSFEVGIRYV